MGFQSERNPKQIDQKSEKNRKKIKKNRYPDILTHIRVYTKQNQKTDAGAVQKPSNHMAGGKDTLQIQLRQKNRGAAVRNQADECGKKEPGNRSGRYRPGDYVLAEKAESEIQQQRNHKDKDKDIPRMLQSGKDNASVFTVTVLLLAEAFDQKVLTVFRLTRFSAGENMADSVNDKAAENADQHFRYEDLQDPGKRNRG